MKGKFIVFEGLDGSGKGTQIALLERRLRERGMMVHVTSEPTQYATGGLVRDALAGLTKRSAFELAGLFLADRIAHNENPADGIKTLINRGFSVICDRYYYSTLAYQGAEIGADWLGPANLECPAILKPDICIFLDIPTKTADQRIAAGRANREIFENVDTIERVRQQYFRVFDMLSDHKIRVINAAGSPEEVAREVALAVDEIF